MDKLREALQESTNALCVLLHYQSDADKPTIHEYGQAHRALMTARAALAEPVADEPGSLINTMDVRDTTFDLPLPVYYDTRPAPAPAESGKYPPLPETDWLLHMPPSQYESEWTSSQEGYTADQMRAYVDADRAQRVTSQVVDLATPSGGLEAGPEEERIEASYWRFDARHKGYGQWKQAPMSERDAFKAEMRNALEAEKVRAEMRLVGRGWRPVSDADRAQRVPLTNEQIEHEKPVCADLVSFRAGVRCAERIFGIGAKP